MKTIITASLLILFITNIINSQTELPTGTSTLFSGSGNCILCHSSNGSGMTWNGIDVSPISYWRSTMMGNASKDPLWRAMGAEEVHNFPQHQELIESTCLKCHSPMGYTQAIYNGQSGYSMAELKQDPLANDGVSCTACHQIKPELELEKRRSDMEYELQKAESNKRLLYEVIKTRQAQLEDLTKLRSARAEAALKRRFERLDTNRDGRLTADLVLDPVDFLRRLAALVPPPYFNMTRYHGVFASRNRLHSRLPLPPPPPVVGSPLVPPWAPAPPNRAPLCSDGWLVSIPRPIVAPGADFTP